MIRIAEATDAEAILEIYKPYIRDTSITFETEIPSIGEFADRIRSYLLQYPWLVFEENGAILGYAYAYQHRARVAYQWSVECSVYIAEQGMRLGVASRLYRVLFAILKRQGIATAYAVINLPNVRSVAFHEKMGFSYFATYNNVGYKLGQWKNVGWWLLQLNEYITDPPTPIPFHAIPQTEVASIIPI